MARDGRTGNEAARDANYRPSSPNQKGKSPKGGNGSYKGVPQISSMNSEHMGARPLKRQRSGSSGD